MLMRCNSPNPTTAFKMCQRDAGHTEEYHLHEVAEEQCGRPVTAVTIWPKVGWVPKRRKRSTQ